jgi:hypothetical protein
LDSIFVEIQDGDEEEEGVEGRSAFVKYRRRSPMQPSRPCCPWRFLAGLNTTTSDKTHEGRSFDQQEMLVDHFDARSLGLRALRNAPISAEQVPAWMWSRFMYHA